MKRFNQMIRGFSLIEVLIALLVLSTGMLALAALQITVTRESSLAKSRGVGIAMAEARLEQIRANAFVDQDQYVGYTGTITEDAAALQTNLEDSGVEGLPTDTAEMGRFVGGYTRTTTITRVISSSVAGDCGAKGAPCFVAAGAETLDQAVPEFKLIEVTVGWTDATGAAQEVTLTDVVPSIFSGNSRKLFEDPFLDDTIVAGPTVRIKIPTDEGIIPIAVSDDSSESAASNPKPTVFDRGSTDKTTYSVLTYSPDPDSPTEATLDRKIDVAVVGCKCLSAGTAGTGFFDTARGITHWDGEGYASPEFVSDTSRGYPDADAVQDQDLCQTCCTDHHDYSAASASVDPYRPSTDYTGDDHNHYSVTPAGSTFVWTELGKDGNKEYNEVCRMIRVDGFFTVAPDPLLLHMSLLETDQAESVANEFAVLDDTARDTYQKFVRDLLIGRFVESNALSPTANTNDPFVINSGLATTYESILETEEITTEIGADNVYLANRGIYVDYLEPDAVAKLQEAVANCPSGKSKFDCMLPQLPLVSINTTDIAQWTTDNDAGGAVWVSNLARNPAVSSTEDIAFDAEGDCFTKGGAKCTAVGNRGIASFPNEGGVESAYATMALASSGIADVFPIDPHDGADVATDAAYEVEKYQDSQAFCVGEICDGGGGADDPEAIFKDVRGGDRLTSTEAFKLSGLVGTENQMEVLIDFGGADYDLPANTTSFFLLDDQGTEYALTVTCSPANGTTATCTATVDVPGGVREGEYRMTILDGRSSGGPKDAYISWSITASTVTAPDVAFSVTVTTPGTTTGLGLVVSNGTCGANTATTATNDFNCTTAGATANAVTIELSGFNSFSVAGSFTSLGGACKAKANICSNYSVTAPSGAQQFGVDGRQNETATIALGTVANGASIGVTLTAGSTITRPVVDSDGTAACSAFACTCGGTDGSNADPEIATGCGN